MKKFPTVTERNIRTDNTYQYAERFYEGLGFRLDRTSYGSVCMEEQLVETTRVEEARHVVFTNLYDVFHKVNGNWCYTYSYHHTGIVKKYLCMGGPKHGTWHTQGEAIGYLPYNSAQGGKEYPSTVLIHQDQLNIS